jgi:hypothetical protein
MLRFIIKRRLALERDLDFETASSQKWMVLHFSSKIFFVIFIQTIHSGGSERMAAPWLTSP